MRYLFAIISLFLLSSCNSQSTSEVLTKAEDTFLTTIREKKKATNTVEEKISFYKPFPYKIISTIDNNVVLETENRKAIIFYNPLSDNQIEMFQEVEKDSSNTILIREVENKAILHIDDVSKEKQISDFDYKVVVVSEKAKLTILTDKKHLEEDVKNLSLIANSVNYENISKK